MAEHETFQEENQVTMKFGKGLVGDPFLAKTGKEMVRISIPNQDPTDKRSWESFVVPANRVHDNQFGKGVWMKLPQDATTTLSRPVVTGQDENGKNIWGKEQRVVSNTELKELMEAYKEKNRDSVLGDLSTKREQYAPTKSASRPFRDDVR